MSATRCAIGNAPKAAYIGIGVSWGCIPVPFGCRRLGHRRGLQLDRLLRVALGMGAMMSEIMPDALHPAGLNRFRPQMGECFLPVGARFFRALP